MLPWVLEYRLDVLAFAAALLLATWMCHGHLRRRGGRGLPALAWLGLLPLLGLAILVPEAAGERERRRLRDMLAGIAPTYAQEMERAGHAYINPSTPAADPLYLSLIAAQLRWLSVNHNVSDIYTYRALPTGDMALIVDSETDYDRDGRYTTPREQRTVIGEIYPQPTPGMRRALAGEAHFDGVPYHDRWGSWVSAYVPLRDSTGRVEAALGVDYDAAEWLRAIVACRALALVFVTALTVVAAGAVTLIVLTRRELDKSEAAARQRELYTQEILRREQKLAESESRFRHVADNAPVMVWMADTTHAMTYVNKPWLEFTGRPVERELGDGWADAVHPDDRAQSMTGYFDAFERRAAYFGEYRLRRYDGEYRWVADHGVPRFSEAGEFLGYIGSVIDITDRRCAEEALRAAARIDKLTGLLNRAAMRDALQHALAGRMDREPAGCAVLFVDFDRFKFVNDTLGHDHGDELLRQIARRLLDAFGSPPRVAGCEVSVTVARQGGDEFVLLLEGLSRPADACDAAEALLRILAAPYNLRGHEVFSTASIGVALADHPAASPDQLLRDADAAMYEAKVGGRNRCVLFSSEMRRRLEQRLSLERDLRDAVAQNQLFLLYQPILCTESGVMESVEALVRWRHPVRGIVPPAEFIPIAEETGLIVSIGEWVLREACRQFMLWRRENPQTAPASISVNLSRNQLALADLADRIGLILHHTGIDPACLHLEITESTVMRDADAAKATLQRIKALGVRLVMDDFGTGYSSLACLHQFPFDVLKIDRSFIQHIGGNRAFAALVQAIVALAGNLGMQVVAEGVETMDQFIALQSLECTAVQGYLFSRPIPAAQIPGFRPLHCAA